MKRGGACDLIERHPVTQLWLDHMAVKDVGACETSWNTCQPHNLVGTIIRMANYADIAGQSRILLGMIDNRLDLVYLET